MKIRKLASYKWWFISSVYFLWFFRCDSYSGCVLMHSLSGGTGSGMHGLNCVCTYRLNLHSIHVLHCSTFVMKLHLILFIYQ